MTLAVMPQLDRCQQGTYTTTLCLGCTLGQRWSSSSFTITNIVLQKLLLQLQNSSSHTASPLMPALQ